MATQRRSRASTVAWRSMVGSLLTMGACSQGDEKGLAPSPIAESPPGLGAFPDSAVLRTGESSQFRAVFSNWPWDTTVVWSISPDSVATVSSTGRVFALRQGLAEVRVETTNPRGFAVKKPVRVVP